MPFRELLFPYTFLTLTAKFTGINTLTLINQELVIKVFREIYTEGLYPCCFA
jgi:hypothetical protein